MAENRGTKYISCILCGAIIPRLGIFLSGVNQDYKIWKYVILRDTDKTKNDYQYEIQVCDGMQNDACLVTLILTLGCIPSCGPLHTCLLHAA